MNAAADGPSAPLHDAHCHLDWVADAQTLAADARAAGTRLFCNTVSPAGYRTARQRFADASRFDNVRVGLGLHPWWVDGNLSRLLSGFEDAFRAADAQTQHGQRLYIGEVGLDFGKRHGQGDARVAQCEAFDRIAHLAAQRGQCVISLHAVNAVHEVLDILEAAGTLDGCTCIFHWFSGPVEALERAVEAGCLFSINPAMAASRCGREHIKRLPAARLLLETDAPSAEGQALSFARLREQLEATLGAIMAIKGPQAAATIARTAAAVGL